MDSNFYFNMDKTPSATDILIQTIHPPEKIARQLAAYILTRPFDDVAFHYNENDVDIAKIHSIRYFYYILKEEQLGMLTMLEQTEKNALLYQVDPTYLTLLQKVLTKTDG